VGVESIRTGLHRIMSDFLRTQPAEEAAVLAWPVVCGAKVASRTKAVHFDAGVLLIEVADINWRNHLRTLEHEYVRHLFELIGPVVKRVEFKLEGKIRNVEASRET
jgi:hypothetical protein